MKRIVILLAIALVVPEPAHATPQHDLYRYLSGKAAQSLECPKLPSTDRFCHPAQVRDSGVNSRLLLSHMKSVDALMSLCIAGDGASCLKQSQHVKAARKLGWCSKTGPDRDFANLVLWARCE